MIVAFAVVSLGAAKLLRPRRPTTQKLESYECGAEPIGEAWVQFPVGFYLVALIFLVFDTLAVFLFPWALTLRGLGLFGLKAMAGFIGILGLAWVYAYREGMLEWK
jgi:NADH:ubiquinone oxidoreductase subunit 3 (subunit A)